MRILLIGATGMVGSRIAAEARDRGHDVTGVTRGGTEGTERGDARDPLAVARLARGKDAVVLAVSPPRDGSDPYAPLREAGRGVIEGLRTAGVRRLMVVGGAGTLEDARGVRLVDDDSFPAEYKGESLAQGELLELLRDEAGDLDWTYVSPASTIEPGERTGDYRVDGDRLLVDGNGVSHISAEDYAVALLDVLEKGQAVRQRIGVAY
ncbi:NAD(P)-dependent oxidoreductase [Actinomadura sp. 21ATH]|uniref:NAD(P)-dependent oxidoreductase n=1 Tax=Actinomadura sp. 21ATH TaxID=1735444 RepID=UPI0035BEDA62